MWEAGRSRSVLVGSSALNKSASLGEALLLGSARALLTTSGSPFSYLARAMEPRQVLLADVCTPIKAREPCFHYLGRGACNVSQASCVGSGPNQVRMSTFQEFQQGRINSGVRNPDNFTLPGGASPSAPNC